MSDIFKICGIENDKIIESIKENAAKTQFEMYDANVVRSSDELQHNINIDRRWDIVRDVKVTSHRKLSGKIIVAFKNKTVKLYKWYTDRLFDQQVEFNHAMWESYYELKNEIKELKKELEELKSEDR